MHKHCTAIATGCLKKIECCKRGCEWKMCKDRSNSCNKEEVMTKVTETNCQVKPCPRVVRCCSIVPTEETAIVNKRIRKPTVKDRKNKKPDGRKKIVRKPSKKVKPVRKPMKKPTRKPGRRKDLGNPLLQPGWYYNIDEDLEDEEVEDEDFEDDSLSNSANDFNSMEALSSSSLGDNVGVAGVYGSDCVDVRFENSGDMLFASCKGYVIIEYWYNGTN